MFQKKVVAFKISLFTDLINLILGDVTKVRLKLNRFLKIKHPIFLFQNLIINVKNFSKYSFFKQYFSSYEKYI